MRRGDFSNYRDVNGNLIQIYDPATGRDVNGTWVRDPFPGNIIPQDRINPIAREIMQYYPLPNNTTAGVAPWQQNLAFAEHFNKDVFWNWVAKVDHNIGANNRTFFRWAENERNELRNTSPIRSGPAQDGQLPLIRANRAIVGDWVHILGGGTVLNLRGSYTYFLELSRSDEGFGFDATQLGFPQASSTSCRSSIFPRVEHGGIRAAVARPEREPQLHLVDAAQHLADPRAPQRPCRSRLPQHARRRPQRRRGRHAVRLQPRRSRSVSSTAPTCCREARSRRSCSAPRPAAWSTTTCCPTTAGRTPRPGSRTTGRSPTAGR